MTNAERKYEIQKKTNFVTTTFQNLLREIDCYINKAEYEMLDNNEEYVTITYNNGYKKRICVTADSYKAIVLDVIRETH